MSALCQRRNGFCIIVNNAAGNRHNSGYFSNAQTELLVINHGLPLKRGHTRSTFPVQLGVLLFRGQIRRRITRRSCGPKITPALAASGVPIRPKVFSRSLGKSCQRSSAPSTVLHGPPKDFAGPTLNRCWLVWRPSRNSALRLRFVLPRNLQLRSAILDHVTIFDDTWAVGSPALFEAPRELRNTGPRNTCGRGQCGKWRPEARLGREKPYVQSLLLIGRNETVFCETFLGVSCSANP